MRAHRWIVRLASLVVPRAQREEWRAEWESELHYREAARDGWSRHRRIRLDLIRPSVGAFIRHGDATPLITPQVGMYWFL